MDWLKNKLDSLTIDFVKPRWIFASISGVMVIVSWILFFGYPGPQWGIDFQGGTEIHLKFLGEPVGEGGVRDALGGLPGIGG